jgi:hypothetical protein
VPVPSAIDPDPAVSEARTAARNEAFSYFTACMAKIEALQPDVRSLAAAAAAIAVSSALFKLVVDHWLAVCGTAVVHRPVRPH